MSEESVNLDNLPEQEPSAQGPTPEGPIVSKDELPLSKEEEIERDRERIHNYD